MKFAIPIYAIVEVRDQIEADQIKIKLENLLGQQMIKMSILAQGIQLQATIVEKPYQTKPDFQVPGATGPRR
jgi:hypothetical protein